MTQLAKTEVSNRISRKEYLREIPTIYESQLWPKMPSSSKKGMLPLDIMGKSYIIALTGPRGGIKTGSLAYLSIYAMAKGFRVISNLPTKCKLINEEGSMRLLETEPLDIEVLIMDPNSLEGSLIAWDEYQQFDRSGSHMTTQHHLLIAEWEQIRKQEITFAYVAKRINLVPGDVAWETDIEINCRDVSNLKKEIEGSRTAWEIKDLSGYWTGRLFDPRNPIIYRFGFYHRAIMGSYDTRQRFDPLEAKRGFQVDLQKRLITDKEQATIPEEEYQQLKEEAILILSEGPARRPMFFNSLGVDDVKLKNYLQRRFRNEIGLKEYQYSSHTMVKI